MLYYICNAMQMSESIDFTRFSFQCNRVLKYNNWYNKTSILMLFYALNCFFKFFKVNEYNTLGAKEYLQFYS